MNFLKKIFKLQKYAFFKSDCVCCGSYPRLDNVAVFRIHRADLAQDNVENLKKLEMESVTEISIYLPKTQVACGSYFKAPFYAENEINFAIKKTDEAIAALNNYLNNTYSIKILKEQPK